MKETQMPPAKAANLVANNGNTIYGVGVIAERTLNSVVTFLISGIVHLRPNMTPSTKV